MSDTMPNIAITTEPIAISIASSITIGTAIRISNVGNWPVFFATSTAKPDKTGYKKISVSGYGSVYEVGENSSEVWVWSESDNKSSLINVELA